MSRRRAAKYARGPPPSGLLLMTLVVGYADRGRSARAVARVIRALHRQRVDPAAAVPVALGAQVGAERPGDQEVGRGMAAAAAERGLVAGDRNQRADRIRIADVGRGDRQV